MNTNKPRIIILGAGYAGIEAAKHLYKHSRGGRDLDITIIDKNPYHTLMTDLHEVAGSRVADETVKISLARIFGGKNVNVVVDKIESIDFDAQILKSDYAEYQYDYLAITVGGAPEFFALEGAQDNSLTLWSFEDAVRIRRRIRDKFDEASREPDVQKRKILLSFAVAGAGFTGVELAGEILEWRNVLCNEYRIDRSEVSVTLIEAMDKIIPILPESLRKKARKRLEKMGANIRLESPIFKVEEDKIIIEGGEELPASTLVWTCGIQGSEFTAKINLTKGRTSNDRCSFASAEGIHGMAGCRFEEDEKYIVGERGRILVDEHMRSVDYKNVYLGGDCIWFLEGEKVVPQIVETAIQTAKVVATNILASIKNKAQTSFKSNYHGFMVSVGSQYAVANVMGMKLSGFLAMGLKHLINLHYLWGLAGLNAVWWYLKHEFFTTRNHRSMIWGHASAKVPAYWAVPLRLFVGAKWLIEGIKKVMDGWLVAGSNYIVPDATSAASAVEESHEAWEAVRPLLAEPIGIYTWFAEHVLSLAPTLFQSTVVFAEILIGLALIGGLFTFLASAASVALCLMFIVSAMGGSEVLWFMAAGIVFLGGAGKGFGLDHWVMPWIKSFWNRTDLAQRTYFYIDEAGRKRGK